MWRESDCESRSSSVCVSERTEVDVEKEESHHATSKFKDRANIAEKIARINAKKTPLSASAMKCYCGCNRHGERDKAMSSGASTHDHPRRSDIKTWEHVVQCRKVVSMRA